ncbi:MAG: calcium/proton exchanger [Actinomycetota bacterium]|nr:calcium/proton exchanger [Actinomycetota bacterium]
MPESWSALSNTGDRAVNGYLAHLRRSHRVTIAACVASTAAAGALVGAGADPVSRFIVAGLAVALLAALVGQAIDEVGERLGPGPTGLLQSTLGNLPELFVGLFALREGLTGVVRAALVGSILGNALLVLGLAFLAGGLRHGTQRFDAEEPRLNASLLMLVVAALLVPTLASHLSTPAAAHAGALSDVLAVVLLIVYVLSIPYYLRRTATAPALATDLAAEPDATPVPGQPAPWPLALSTVLLALGSLGAAVASDWFVSPLEKATRSLGLSQTFTGLVIVALASNAVEHAVGVRFAWKAKPEYAISTTLNSPLQVALLLTPVLVLVSTTVGPSELTLVFPPLLVAALAISAIVVTGIIYDGEYTWIEGVALIALYFILAAAFWWG